MRLKTNRSWTNFRVDRRNPRYCHVTFDHPPINAITATAVAELSDLVGLIEKLNHFRPCNSTKSKVRLLNAASEDTQAAFADALNVAAFFLTNSCTLSGRCPVSISTSSVILSNRPARCRSAIAARWFTT